MKQSIAAVLRNRSSQGKLLLLVTALSVRMFAQVPASHGASSSDQGLAATVQELQQQVGELKAAVAEMRSEAAQYRAETAQLRSELAAMHSPQPEPANQVELANAASNLETTSPSSATESGRQSQPLEKRVASLEESAQLLTGKLEDQYQTKVESASKYRVRLSGIVLMNLFSNRGTTDNMDIPSLVIGPNQGSGNFGATLRQSEIGLEAFGPKIAGARTSANLEADFAGGFADTWNGVNSGIFRLRIASARMDWDHTSLVVGQDDLFISPNSPTSFASLAVPAFNYAGNLWAWTPQVRVEHRFALSGSQNIAVQAGILDNLTGEFPASSYFRSPGPGEASAQPAYAVRTSWNSSLFGRPLVLGAAGYYSRQDWEFSHYSDGWAGLADWEIPLANRVSLSGEFYRGRAVGGIGGGVSRSVIFLGNPALPSTAVRSLDSRGGWTQLKLRATGKLEFNAGFGIDSPNSSEVRLAAGNEPYLGELFVRNVEGLVNFVYRPRSNLLFSTEFRHLESSQLYNINNSAQQVNLMMGVLF
ncbi:MAG TPA: hypothetical protein VFB28_07160 [Terriglobales bacterium]|nr:hypothetical protein [Terriglobales bacterium]